MTLFDGVLILLLALFMFEAGRRYESRKVLQHIERLAESFEQLEKLILEEKEP